MDDDQFLEFQAQQLNAIAAKLNAARLEGPVTEAIELFMRRIVSAGNSLRVLQKHAPHQFEFDGAMILRGIYDAMLQAVYILHDPASREERAQLYLDSYWIEHHKSIQILDNNSTPFAQKISRSSKREENGPAIEQEFERVRYKFEKANGKLRPHWYGNSLPEIAKAIGLLSEYEILQKLLSGVVHSSAFALKNGPLFRGFLLFDLAWKFSLRVLGKFAEYVGIELDDQREMIHDAVKNVFENP